MRGRASLFLLGWAVTPFPVLAEAPKDDALCRQGARSFSLDDQLPPPTDQGDTSACSVFSGSAAASAAIKRNDPEFASAPIALSEVYYALQMRLTDSEEMISLQSDQVFDSYNSNNKGGKKLPRALQQKILDNGTYINAVEAIFDSGVVVRSRPGDLNAFVKLNDRLTKRVLFEPDTYGFSALRSDIELGRDRFVKGRPTERYDFRAKGYEVKDWLPFKQTPDFSAPQVQGLAKLKAAAYILESQSRIDDFVQTTGLSPEQGIKDQAALVKYAETRGVDPNAVVQMLQLGPTFMKELRQLHPSTPALSYPIGEAAARKLKEMAVEECDKGSKELQAFLLANLCQNIPLLVATTIGGLKLEGPAGRMSVSELQAVKHGMVLKGIETVGGESFLVFRNSFKEYPTARIPLRESCRLLTVGLVRGPKDPHVPVPEFFEEQHSSKAVEKAQPEGKDAVRKGDH